MVMPISAGELLTWAPAARRAAFLFSALPSSPLMMAPAWPMRRPSGAVAPAMKATTGFFTWSLMYCGGFLLGAAADLADHDDRLGVGVFVEHADGLDLGGADDRVAADADAGALADAFGSELGDDFVDERAGAADDADLAREEDVAGHDADAGLCAGGDDAGAVRPDEGALSAEEGALDHDHVHHRDAFGDADDERDFGGGRFEDGVRGEGCGDEDDADVRAGGAHGLVDGGVDRDAVLLFASAPGVDGCHDVRAVGDGAAHVIRALRPDSLDHQARIGINKNSHEDSRFAV